MKNDRNHIARHYTKWAYIFIIPFVVAFLLFNFYPLGSTFYYAFPAAFDSALSSAARPVFVACSPFSSRSEGLT